MPAELLPESGREFARCTGRRLPLKPGHYRLDVVVKDVNGDRVGNLEQEPAWFPISGTIKLASSSLIVADQMEPVATKNVGTGNFVIGTTKVRPRVAPADGKPIAFKRNQKLNFWMQVYNLGVDEKTHKPSATFEYDVVNTATNKAVVHTVESTDTDGQYRRPSDPAKDTVGGEFAAWSVSSPDQGERQHLQADRRAHGDICRRVGQA